MNGYAHRVQHGSVTLRVDIAFPFKGNQQAVIRYVHDDKGADYTRQRHKNDGTPEKHEVSLHRAAVQLNGLQERRHGGRHSRRRHGRLCAFVTRRGHGDFVTCSAFNTLRHRAGDNRLTVIWT